MPILAACAALAAGCAGPGPRDPGRDAPASADGAPVAFVNGQALGWETLRPGLVEARGGEVLAEVVLGRLVEAKLAAQGLDLDDRHVEAEREILLESLSDRPDEARRLLNEVRRRRGIGPRRFDAMLRRNAGLRLLVQDRIAVGEPELVEAFDLLYGPKSEVRLIVVESAAAAGAVVRRARSGEAFSDLAVQLSNHVSAARGGLIGQVSRNDPTLPAELHMVLQRMQPGEVSDVVATSGGFAVVRLERRVDGPQVDLAAVRPTLELWTRRRAERMGQAKLARELVAAADVVVFDRTLNRTWRERIGAAMIE